MAAPAGNGRTPASPPAVWEDISFADLLRTVYRRRAILITVTLATILATVAFTVMATPEYQAQATFVPLAQRDIVENWLRSRQAAELALDDLGSRALPLLGGSTVPQERLAASLASHVSVTKSTRGDERLVILSATMSDPVAARDVVNAYLGTLQDLRPELENITRNEAFIKFYDGSNAQEAQRRAEEVARQQAFWIVLDTPLVPLGPVRPTPIANVALGGTAGVLLGIVSVFGLEWFARFSGEFRGREELRLPTAGRARPQVSDGPAPAPATAPAPPLLASPPSATEADPVAQVPPTALPPPKFTILRGGRPEPQAILPPTPASPDGDNGTGATRPEALNRFWRGGN